MNCEQSVFLKALKRQPVERTPAWMMRQAGRYLPEYREVRQKAGDFMSLCRNPELACEVTLQPLRRFDIDAAILFSDILTIPDAMGLGLHFTPGEGPCFDKPIQDDKDVAALPIPDPSDELSYVMDAVKMIRHHMPAHLPLIGFAGSPWTLACYMVEGGPSRDFKKVKSMLYQAPELMHQLLAKITQATTVYLNAQIESGVNAVMIFDTWGGVLTPSAYQEFSLCPMQKILAGLETRAGKIPTILFTKGGGQWLELMAETGCDALGLDWMTDIGLARQRVGDKVALQGNMDPALLLTTPQRINQEVKAIIDAFGGGTGHIFNLGHGITPDVPVENVQAFFAAVKEHG